MHHGFAKAKCYGSCGSGSGSTTLEERVLRYRTEKKIFYLKTNQYGAALMARGGSEGGRLNEFQITLLRILFSGVWRVSLPSSGMGLVWNYGGDICTWILDCHAEILLEGEPPLFRDGTGVELWRGYLYLDPWLPC